MKKEERLKQQSILANQINNSMLFEMLPLLKINLLPENKIQINTEIRQAIIKYKKIQDSRATRKGV